MQWSTLCRSLPNEFPYAGPIWILLLEDAVEIVVILFFLMFVFYGKLKGARFKRVKFTIYYLLAK